MKKPDDARLPSKVTRSDKGAWIMLSAIIPIFLFGLGAAALRELGAPPELTKALGILCFIAVVLLMIGGALMLRCPLCNHLNWGGYRTATPHCRGCGVEFDEPQYKLW